MKTIIRKTKFIVMLVITVIYTTAISAQTVTEHTVGRGETLESIAKKYNTTTNEITSLNPNAAQFIYVGMKLKIPVKTGKNGNISSDNNAKNEIRISNNQINTVAETGNGNKKNNKVRSSGVYKQQYENYKRNTDVRIEESTLQDSKTNMNDYCHYGLAYNASFEDAGHGSYGLDGTVYFSSGFGFNMGIWANYGLVDSDFAGVSFTIGPAYGFLIGDNIILTSSFDLVYSYAGSGDKPMTGTNGIGETYTYTGKDTYSTWGFALMSRIGVKINKVTPLLGLEFGWSKDAKEVSVGFNIGLEFDI